MTIIEKIPVDAIATLAHAPPATDPYLDIDLHGLQLIEASAGTGKTFTLATLVTRLVVERGLRLGQILAVTFTEAATQELRARLRKRLIMAAAIANELAAEPERTQDDDPEAGLTRRIIRRQLEHEDAAALSARLQRAELEIDLAAVFTIHGFCSRVLTEHALQTGQAFDAPTLIGSERELMDEIAADLWRVHGADPVEVELLHRLWPNPDVLSRDLGALLRAPRLLPPRPDATPDPTPDLRRAFDALCAMFREIGAQARMDLDAAITAKHIDGRKARQASYVKAWDALANGLANACLARSDDHLDKLTPARLRECAKVGCEDKLPPSPLFDALGDWFAADLRCQQWLDAQAVDLLHRIRDEARARLRDLKRQRRLRSYDDLIDGVADGLEGPHGNRLARSLREQYAVALVDEFQDTDARQWAIFRRVFGGVAVLEEAHDDPAPSADAERDAAASLFLIGDPKQAIYGFRGGDVHTYLSARRDAIVAPSLAHNFRSRPGVLRAIEALYAQAGDGAFVDTGIAFQPVAPGPHHHDADYQRDGHPATALTVRTLPAAADGKPFSAGDARALATAACVAEIHAVLGDANEGRATISGQAVQPGDIAVLVRSHAEAARMQAALVGAGIPAVAAGKQSLLATDEAGELMAVFAALLQPADESRLRAALATVLLGVDGASIDRLDHDEDWRRDMQMQALAWRERWQRHGPLALVSDLCARHAVRLLGLVDGERRLTNLMQLGELLQEADARALGLHGLVDWLRTRIAEADPDDEQQLLRLESDARRVQILTLHKSKGLEFPLVYLPFVGIGKRLDKPARHCQVPDAAGRVMHWKAGREDDDAGRWQEACARYEHEQRAEDARLLYVGLTRARHALWLACGPFYQAGATALAPMLADLAALGAHADIAVDGRDAAGVLAPLPPAPMSVVPNARQARRVLSRDWWVYSFTQLTHAAGSADAADEGDRSDAPERAAADEPATTLPEPSDAGAEREPIDYRFAGSRFGNVLHAALEHVEFGAWRDWRAGCAPPPAQDAPLRAALAGEGYVGNDLDDGVAELTALAGQTLTVGLPEGTRLCDLPLAARRAEMEFHFALQPTSVTALLATLHAHGVLIDRHGFGLRRQLEGLMTGKIDLVYLHDGRYYVLDYKSNRLPDYRPATIERAMAESEYTLQAIIYTLALHRWLRFRLGDGYDYSRDFGGVRYLFCRGLDAAADPSPGLHAQQPPRALVDALDALFSARAVAA